MTQRFLLMVFLGMILVTGFGTAAYSCDSPWCKPDAQKNCTLYGQCP